MFFLFFVVYAVGHGMGIATCERIWNVDQEVRTIPISCGCSRHCKHEVTVTAACHITEITTSDLGGKDE